MLTWDVPKIFRLLGGPTRVAQYCAMLSPGTTQPLPGTIAVWKHRRRISATWLPVVVAACLSQWPNRHDLFVDDPTLDRDDADHQRDEYDMAAVGL